MHDSVKLTGYLLCNHSHWLIDGAVLGRAPLSKLAKDREWSGKSTCNAMTCGHMRLPQLTARRLSRWQSSRSDRPGLVCAGPTLDRSPPCGS